MPKFSEIADRAMFRQSGIDVEPLRSWWRTPIDNERTNESLLKDSFSDSLVGDGIWQCILTFDQAGAGRQISAEWLSSAVTAVQRGGCLQFDAAPLWLLWISGTAGAIDFWRRCNADKQYPCQGETLLTGMEFIRNGLPALALSYWKQVRRATRHQIRRERVLRERATSAIREAQHYADALSVNLPPLEDLDTDASLRTIIHWYDNLRESTILQHFWQDHLEYLVRLHELDSNSDLLALIRTAEKRNPVTFATLQKLLLVNRDRTESLLHGLR